MANKLKTTIKKILPEENEKASSLLGKGKVTAYGSEDWSSGLDFVLENPPVKALKNGSVKEVVQEKDSDGFGNQIKVVYDDGVEVWYSHLAQLPTIKPGTKFKKGEVIAVMGNTGNVNTFDETIGEYRDPTQEEKEQQAGTHLDITIPKPEGGFYSSKDVAKYHGIKK